MLRDWKLIFNDISEFKKNFFIIAKKKKIKVKLMLGTKRYLTQTVTSFSFIFKLNQNLDAEWDLKLSSAKYYK